MSKILRVRNGFSVLKSVCRLRLKKAWRALCRRKVFKRKCEISGRGNAGSLVSIVLYYITISEAAKRRGNYPPLASDTEVNNCFSIYQNSEIIEHKNMIFNSFTVASDYNFGAQWPKGRGRHFFLPTNKTSDGIYLARAGKSLQKELWILFVFKIIL